MYYPYLRGRQYELLAVKELVEKGILTEHVIPIIEPVKLSPTLISTLASFQSCNHPIIVIQNPEQGDFQEDCQEAESDARQKKFLNSFFNVCDSDIVQKAWIVNRPFASGEYPVDGNLNTFICADPDQLDYFIKVYREKAACVVYPAESPFLRRLRFVKNRITLSDPFNKQERNADYIESEDEYFSEDHLYYAEDGYEGFSDYSIIGNYYSEAGFAPYTVAIHVVYLNENGVLRIHHFVSDSNDDIRNPAGKYYEALKKLQNWYLEQTIGFQNRNTTLGLQTFLEHYKNGVYPGLGTVKKLSIMHHLELMGKYLDQVKS